MRLAVDAVEPEIARLWKEEADRGGAPRIGLLTLVAIASELPLVDRAAATVAAVARTYPSRTLVALWREAIAEGAPGDSITADATLHHMKAGGNACGDAITLEARGAARDWIPESVDRLALPDLPVCVWWVGDLPDFDRLFDRLVVRADLVVVNSNEMDLRDIEKLSTIVKRMRDTCALSDLTWIRLRPLQELVARFFDDETGLSLMKSIDRVTIEFMPREGQTDAASTSAGLLFGWIANALSLADEKPGWKRGAGWAEVTLGRVVTRFVQRQRDDVPGGSLLRVTMECDGARFDVERLEDPNVFRWSREVPGAPVPPQTLQVGIPDETKLLIRCLEFPRRDPLLEKSLHVATHVVRPVAPRLSTRAGA
jgi:glucose-6-phosphate dehydrogenase assembly protein OpcA